MIIADGEVKAVLDCSPSHEALKGLLDAGWHTAYGVQAGAVCTEELAPPERVQLAGEGLTGVKFREGIAALFISSMMLHAETMVQR